VAALQAHAQVALIARGELTSSHAGYYKDLSGLNYTLENGASANLLGGLGSGLTYVSGDTFLAVPDRGPNAVPFDSLIDNTVSYIERVHTLKMRLEPNNGGGLPYTVVPTLLKTTLLYSSAPLVYGSGEAYGVGSGAPALNKKFRYYFTGRSDNFDPSRSSADPFDARLDAESIRVSNDGLTAFISDEYGPYIYQFFRPTGERIRSYRLPSEFYVAHPNTTTTTEQAGNTSGRVPNKGMEGLAITPDGRTLVGILQAPTIQDAALGGAAGNLLRLAAVDVETGAIKGEYAYLLTTGSGVSDITALNDHEFLVDERDGKGLGDGSKAKVKQIFKIDLAGATGIQGLNGIDAATHAVPKTLFLDIVQVLTANGMTTDQIPAKLEGITFGPDTTVNGKKVHTFWVANDNDFLQDYNSVTNSNPNQYFVFGFTDADLAGSKFVPQQVRAKM
jgi:hypothetical protein